MEEVPKIPEEIPLRPAFTLEARDDSVGLLAYVCIHAVGEWGSSGGIRCVGDITREEVEYLARAMTFKFAFFGIPQGGAKGGLRLPYDASPDDRRRLIRSAAQHLEPLLKRSNLWSPWSDMNFYADDLRLFMSSIDIPSPWSEAAGGMSAQRTAIQAFWSVQAAAGHFLRNRACTVALEGYGAVGEQLAGMLALDNFKVAALSNDLGAVVNRDGLDLAAVAAAQQQYGRHWVEAKGPWSRVERRELLALDVDILVPGARVHSIDAALAERLAARLVVPVANVPCTHDALAVLERRGIVYVPDFVVGGGGACGWIRGVDDEYGEAFKDMMVRMLRLADRLGATPRSLCEQEAHRGYAAIHTNAYRTDSLRKRVLTKARAWSHLDARRPIEAGKIERIRAMFRDQPPPTRPRSSAFAASREICKAGGEVARAASERCVAPAAHEPSGS